MWNKRNNLIQSINFKLELFFLLHLWICQNFHWLNGIFDFTFKIWAQQDFLKNIRYTDLWANLMCKTFCDFKQVYLHVQSTSTWVFWLPYKKWWYIVNIIDVIIYSWSCTWTFVRWTFNEMNTKCWNNIFIEKLYLLLNSLGSVYILRNHRGRRGGL